MGSAARESKAGRREAARLKAQEGRLREQRRTRRNRVLLQVAVGVVLVMILAVVALIIVHTKPPIGAGPKNMADGGISLQGASLTAITTLAAAADATPRPQRTAPGGRVLIQAYEDFGCPNCRIFEEQYGEQIKQLVASGAAVIQYHPVAILDRAFPDHNYSTRAANAAAAIANYSPNAYAAFHALMYDAGNQPKEGTAGPTDARLLEIAKQAGATHLNQIAAAIKNQTYKNWITARTDESTSDSGPLQGIDFSRRLNPDGSQAGPGTPTLIVNGKYWDATTTFDNFVTTTAGALPTTTQN